MLPARMVSGDRYLYCPYDDTHEILAKSFSAHLIKCRRNHSGHKLVSCPLDSTHKIPKPEMPYHLSVCDKRCLMDREMQKRAGDNGLKGDVVGPPIVADHSAGQEREGEESWDDVPKGAFITPALFNQRPSRTQETSSYNPPGGYVPPKKEESIRKVPNAPAKAATLSNPASAQMRPPGPNQIFNYSLGLTDAERGAGMMRMPMMNANRPANPGVRIALGSGVRVSGQDQGPRFIGRGISKYATKSQPYTPATAQQTRDMNDLEVKLSSTTEQFDDKTNADNTQIINSQVSVQQQQQQQQQQQHLQMQKMFEDEMTKNVGDERPLSEEELAMKQQQQFLQTGILLSQQEQLKQLKNQQRQQELELAKKHELQMLQLQKLQLDERQRLLVEQERVEQELRTSQAVSLSLLNNPPAGPAGFPHQSFLPPGLLEAIGKSGGEGLSGFMAAGMKNQSNSVGPRHLERKAAVKEAWHENGGNNSPQFLNKSNDVESVHAPMSRVSVPNSNNGDDASNNPQSETDVIKLRSKLEKRLKEIEILEQKSCLGHRLSAEEERKLYSKDEIVANLKHLLHQS